MNTATAPAEHGQSVESTRVRNAIFAAPAEDPRTRRPADAFVLGLCLVIVVIATWAYESSSDPDQRVVQLFSGDLPGWLSGTLTLVFMLGGLYSIVLLVAIAAFGQGRRAVARDMVLAVVLAFATAVAASWLAGEQWPELFPEFTDRQGVPSYPVARLSMSFALLSVAGPYLSLPMRTVGRRLLIAMVVAAVVLNYGTISAVVGGIALGVGAASAVRLMFGSGVGIPSLARVTEALGSCGLAVVDLGYLDEHPVGATLARADLDAGGHALVKIYGRDAADAATASRLWRAMWFTDLDQSLTASGLQQVEHESLMLLQGARAGLPVPELLGFGRGRAGDAVLATRWLDGPRLIDLPADDIDDDVLRRCWETIDRFHRAGIAHRKLDAALVAIVDDGVIVDDLSSAVMSPAPLTRAIDLAQMLVTTVVAVGSERAIAVARSCLGDDRLGEALPLVQRSALSSRLQAQVKLADINLKRLRAEVAEAIGASSPDVRQLARITWGSVAMIALTLFAASALISSLADIGFDTIIEELSQADWSWVVTAFVLAQLTNLGEYLSLTGMVQRPVPFGPTILFRYALSFITLAVPSEAGAIAMNVQYMRKLGVPAASALAQGPLLTVISKSLDVILLILAAQVVDESISLEDIDSGPMLRLVVFIVGLAIVGIVLALAIPRIRRLVLPPVKAALTDVRTSITDPERLVRVLGGSLASRLLFAMTLSASVSAYGWSISFAEAVFVNSIVSLFVGLMPVPGGIGVGEAALTAGLTLVGVPESVAFAAALTHRIVTAYLPPVGGFFTTRWLTARDYL